MSNNFLTGLVKELDDEFTSMASDGISSAEFTGTIDSGSLIFNGLVSGSLFGGIADNKAMVLAGESATGKTFFVLGIIKYFLDKYKDSGVIYFDTEAAVTKDMMIQRGIDPTRVIISEPETIQQFRTQALKFVEKYNATPLKNRPKMAMVLDSLGALSTSKEMADSSEGKDTRDMTRQQIIRGTFRTVRLKLAKAGVPMFVTNHTYLGIGGMYPTQEMSGGGGAKYAGDTILYLSKRKEKDGKDVIGNIIHVKTYKSRLSKENQMVDVLLTYNKGLDRYYGLLPLAEKHGIVKKVSTRFEFPDGTKAFEKAINKNPEKYWTEDILMLLEAAAQKEFKYGMGEIMSDDIDGETDEAFDDASEEA